ncbi:hypothetical protein WKW50_18730 [Ochrobactrum sp. GPK 3]|uniref:hypothetical protein n=1 Tax=Brucella sp. 22210 TaxID=3453892 RepID=UPI003138523A
MSITKYISGKNTVAFEEIFSEISPALSSFDFIIHDCDGFRKNNESDSENIARKKEKNTSNR